MQPPNHTMSPMAPISPASITTEQIQKYLDENKQLILAILDNQNLGKLAECAQYQTQLQKNLLYLAAIADAQSPAPTAHPQQGSPFGQQQQQHTPLYPSRAAQPFNLQHTRNQVQQMQHLQTMFPGHAGTRPVGNTSELLPGNALQATRRMQGEATECGGLPERT